MYTNNALNCMPYAKIDLDVFNKYFAIKGRKGRWNKDFVSGVHNAIRNAIRGEIQKTPKCNDYYIDQIIRNNVVLPSSVLNTTHIINDPTKDNVGKWYDFHEKIWKLDENSCYFSALTKFGAINIPDDVICMMNDLPSEGFENNSFYSFRVNLTNPRIRNHDLYPLSQPSNIEDESLDTRGRFGTELDVSVANIEAVVNVYVKDDKIINEFNYLEAKYFYDNMEFVSGYKMRLTDETINWNTPMIELIFNTLKYIKDNGKKDESKLYATIQQLLKTTLGVSFTRLPDPKEKIDVRLTVVDPYTVIQEIRERTRPRKSSNRIFITPILYTIVNEHIRSWMNIVPYRYHVKGTADAMFITNEGYYRYAFHKMEIGTAVGKFKTAFGNLRSYDAKLWILYDDNKNIVEMAHGGITKDVAKHLKTLDDWENRNEIAKKHGTLKYNLEDLFTFKRYINELNEKGYKTKHDYSEYPTYKNEHLGKLALLGGQGTGKTTAVVNALKYTSLNVLHLFYNKYPAQQNKEVYNLGYKTTYKHKKDVRTIDSMIHMIYKKSNVGRPNYDNMRKSAINDSNALLNFTSSFDVVVIDEIQSINGYNREIILKIIEGSKNVIMVGDFNQEWKKNYRSKTPFSMIDIQKHTDKIFKLDVNYRNSKNIFEYGKRVLDDNTRSGNNESGVAMLIRVENEEELKTYLEDYKNDNEAVIVSRHSRVRGRIYKTFNIKARSVSDTKSTSPTTVVLVNSTKVGLHEKVNPTKEYEAIKEIWSALLRPKQKLIVLEYEGWL